MSSEPEQGSSGAVARGLLLMCAVLFSLLVLGALLDLWARTA